MRGGSSMASKAKAKVAAPKFPTARIAGNDKVSKSGVIRARIAPDLKAEAERILDQIGLSSSDAIRMFYKQVTLCRGLPFEARIPNATTRKALRDAEDGRNLTEYADADELFTNLGVKRGQS
jgi:DNA-damage-inducible protein J